MWKMTEQEYNLGVRKKYDLSRMKMFKRTSKLNRGSNNEVTKNNNNNNNF